MQVDGSVLWQKIFFCGFYFLGDIGSSLRGRMGRRYWQFKERKV